jgi:hypothetical protein
MKKVIIFLSLLALGIFISSFSEDKKDFKINNFTTVTVASVPTEVESYIQEFNIPFIGNRFVGFREALAFKESQGRYGIVNTFGYLGKYQFGKSTLQRFKIYDTHSFLQNPELQEDAFLALCSLNKWILRKDIKRSVGKNIHGIEITESGIIAAAHLAGAGNVKKFLRSGGAYTFQDAYGSSVKHYLKEFSGYDTSLIKAKRKPVI